MARQRNHHKATNTMWTELWRCIGLALLGVGVTALGLSGCNRMKASPWQTDIPAEARGLTYDNLQALAAQTAASANAATADKFRIALIGDPQGTPGDFRQVVERINAMDDVDFILVLGDLTDYGLKHEYEWAYEALKKSRIPYFTAVGNHDAISHGKQIYQRMFGAFDYTFIHKGIKFVIWNNNKNEFGDHNIAWLAQQVDHRTVVASHIPPTPGDVHSQEEVDHWLAIANQAGIVASLHGHRGGHRGYRQKHGKAPYFVVAKTHGVHFAIATFTNGRLSKILECTKTCPVENF